MSDPVKLTDLQESRFTAARDFCPHPEYWHSDDGDSTEHEVIELVAALVRALQPELVLETGSGFGASSYAIGEALKRNGHGRLVTLENDLARFQAAEARCRGLPVQVVPTKSLDYTPDGQIGFAWFDSSFPDRPREFLRFRPWMQPGIIVAFHDSGPQHPVAAYLQALVSEKLIRPIFLHTPRGVCLAEVL
jgi:predicted O-methyltransferase YrrM